MPARSNPLVWQVWNTDMFQFMHMGNMHGGRSLFSRRSFTMHNFVWFYWNKDMLFNMYMGRLRSSGGNL